MSEAQTQHDRDSKELRRLCAERDELRRWKSTHGPRLEALEVLLKTAQLEAAKGAEAIASLESEREANAILTAELEAQQAQAPGWQHVPVEPTPEMMCAGCEPDNVYTRHDLHEVWAAMLAAAPQQGAKP